MSFLGGCTQVSKEAHANRMTYVAESVTLETETLRREVPIENVGGLLQSGVGTLDLCNRVAPQTQHAIGKGNQATRDLRG